MAASVTRMSAPPRKPNRRRGAIPASPDTVTLFIDPETRKRATRFAAAYRRESARTGTGQVAAARS